MNTDLYLNFSKMNIDKFYIELSKLLPSSIDKGSDFMSHLSKCLKTYEDLLAEIDEIDRPSINNWEDLLSEVHKLCKAIEKTVKLYYKAQHSSAYNLLKRQLINKTYMIARIQSKENWYRMRKKETGIGYKEMFHIPFSKRGKVGTNRFSVPGYPCLYLCRSIIGCSKEMNRLKLDTALVSRIINQESIYALDFSIPSVNNLKRYYVQSANVRSDYLKRMPIIIASMIKVKNNKDLFKPEYIIPQLLMEFTIEATEKKLWNEATPISGILYTSVHAHDKFQFLVDENDSLFLNLAIPATNVFEGEYSKNICNNWLITEPTSCNCKTEKPSCYTKYASTTNSKGTTYKDTPFGQLEELLKNEFLLKHVDYKDCN